MVTKWRAKSRYKASTVLMHNACLLVINLHQIYYAITTLSYPLLTTETISCNTYSSGWIDVNNLFVSEQQVSVTLALFCSQLHILTQYKLATSGRSLVHMSFWNLLIFEETMGEDVRENVLCMQCICTREAARKSKKMKFYLECVSLISFYSDTCTSNLHFESVVCRLFRITPP